MSPVEELPAAGQEGRPLYRCEAFARVFQRDNTGSSIQNYNQFSQAPLISFCLFTTYGTIC